MIMFKDNSFSGIHENKKTANFIQENSFNLTSSDRGGSLAILE